MKILGVKHLAIAVVDCDAALAQYQCFLGIDTTVTPRDLLKGGSREAHFMFGDVQIQLCQSLTPEHRFALFVGHVKEWGKLGADAALLTALKEATGL